MLGFLLLGGCASTPQVPSTKQEDMGVLIMAHGGSAQWNKEVLAGDPSR